ncbi:hypothetical protein [Streptomyces asiaticus]|uniref:hypothetical protein n=1 Tax=Streptomyces asiaticus TaxID=114695 RepID=UPI001BA5DC7D|nr:hypothetical protein [Streptomyces asiaticus]
MKILGREPAAWAALASILLQTIGAFVANFDAETQAWVNAVVLAALGLIVAVMVHDGVIAAIAGFVQATITLAVGLGLDWSAERQAAVLIFVTAAAQFAVRQTVTAPVPPLPAPAARRTGPTGV